MTTQKRRNPTADQVLRNRLAEDPEFREAWEEGEPAFMLAREIIRARQARGWSQAQLAEAMGTTQAVVSRLERMETKASLETADRAAQALGRQLQLRFVSDEDRTEPVVPTAGEAFDEAVRRVAELMAKSSEQVAQVLRDALGKVGKMRPPGSGSGSGSGGIALEGRRKAR